MITINLKDDERGITIRKCVTNQMLKEMLSDNPLAYVMKSVMDEYEKEKVNLSVRDMANDDLHKTEVLDMRGTVECGSVARWLKFFESFTAPSVRMVISPALLSKISFAVNSSQDFKVITNTSNPAIVYSFKANNQAGTVFDIYYDGSLKTNGMHHASLFTSDGESFSTNFLV